MVWEQVLFMISKILNLRCVLWPRKWSILENVSWGLAKNVYSAVLDEAIYRCLVYPVDSWCCSVQLYPYWFSSCWICPFFDRGLLKSSTIIVDSFISPCRSISFCLIEFDTLLLGAYTLRIVMSFGNAHFFKSLMTFFWCLLFSTYYFYTVIKFAGKISLGKVWIAFLLDPCLLFSLIIQWEQRSENWRLWEVFLNWFSVWIWQDY